ncbi:MAG: 2-oxo acid dehydrogenase subunit E2 [Myxococcales bacterium]|nr:2-oxo acid dehydrogenase subunit E2 [Myxococcales bacterium]MCB9702249.1 2-oxo acid dehydrogenase subunit E2 [Myxococcales bacterium]
MPHLHLKRKRDLSAFRRLAIGTWRTTYDPQAYGRITLEMDQTIRYIEAFRRATGKRLTVTHLMAKAAGRVLKEVPDANAILRWNRIYLREEISVFFQVAMRDPKTGQIDLSGVKIDDPQDKSLAAIVDEFEEHAGRVRAGEDRDLEATRQAFRWVPALLLNKALDALDFLVYKLNLNLSWAGLPHDPYGSIMITNIGTLGLEEAFAPLLPHGHVGIIVAIGAIQDAPVVRGGEVVVGKTMPLSATFDHRLLDGAHAAKMVSMVKTWLEDPFRYFDPIPGPSGAEAEAAEGEAEPAAESAPAAEGDSAAPIPQADP